MLPYILRNIYVYIIQVLVVYVSTISLIKNIAKLCSITVGLFLLAIIKSVGGSLTACSCKMLDSLLQSFVDDDVVQCFVGLNRLVLNQYTQPMY